MKSFKFALVAALIAAGCAGNAKKDTPPVEEPGFLLRGEGRAIPPLAPLELTDAAPDAQKGDSVGATTEYRVGDLRVLHKQTKANAVVQARVYILGGNANLTAETAGIEALALGVATTGGTEQTPKDAFNAQLDRTGSSIFSFTDLDFSGYGLKTLTEHFDDNWELFAQSVLSPAMPEDEVQIRRTQQLASIAAMKDDPDSHVLHLERETAFDGHPYEYFHVGTKENVASFTRDELLAYQRAMLVPANMLVVVVGNVEADDLLNKVRKSFGRIAPRRAAPIELPPMSSAPGAHFAQQEISTSYILGMFAAPGPGHPDYPAMLVATDYLRERLFEEVRTKRNLTYAVNSGLADQRSNYGYLYVTATDPEATLPVMFAEVEKLRTNKLTPEALKQTVNVFVTEHYMGLQTNGSQASSLAAAELTGGDWKDAEQMLTKIRAVTPDDVQRVAEQYIKDYRFAIVGPRTDIAPELFSGSAN